MTLRLSGMTAGLAIGITAAVVSACAAGAYLYSLHHFESLVETARASALGQGELMREALEHQMLENDRTLIDRMVRSFGRQPRVERVMVLDRGGAARFSSAPLDAGTDLAIGSPTCQACHQRPPEQRSDSQVIDTAGGSVLRTVVPVRNRPECHRCHSPEHRINGILILDTSAAEIRASMDRDLWWMVGGSAAIALALIAVIALVVRYSVLRRLQRFETTARLIAAGDLERRVPASGSDTISWLAREFNTMADAMTGLISDVRDERERLETVINSIGDGIVVLDAERRVIAANEAFLERTGGARRDVLGCACRRIADGMCSAAECPTTACLQTGERQVRICQRASPSGASVWEEVHASPIRGPSGAITRVVEVWRDISDRRAAEARLAESYRLASVGVLASGFSHELNTPLATVLTCVEGILRDTRAPSNQAPDLARMGETATIAREQLLRCRAVTQHFLRLSRGQSAPGDLVDVRAAVAAAVRLTMPEARAHGVALDAEVAGAPLHVRVDEAELQHALMNLLLNAVQSCRGRGQVRVRVADGDPVIIRVTDDGCGIDPEHQTQIFEPFFSMRQGGTGLGLFLALNFVRRWGGEIGVTSARGRGSTFEVRLPALAAAAGRPA